MNSHRISRSAVVVSVVVILIGSVTIFAIVNGYHPRVADLRLGAAWLSSERIGEVALVDGVSAEVSDRVKVARTGSRLGVIQSGADAYALNRDEGTVTRIDGITHNRSLAVQLLHGAREQDRTFVAGGRIHQFDPVDGRLAVADARRLVPDRDPVDVGGKRQSAVTSDGRLWLYDTASGNLSWYSGFDHNLRGSLRPPSDATMFLETGRHPILLESKTGIAQLLDPESGRSTRSMSIAGWSVDASIVGSTGRPSVLVVRPDRGTLTVCRFHEERCRSDIQLGEQHRFGKPVEIENHVLVPDYTTGQLIIVDLAVGGTVDRLALFDDPVEYQLIVQDGIVFVNDPLSERAGVVRSREWTFVLIKKYNPQETQPTAQAPAPDRTSRHSSTPQAIASRSSKPSTGPGTARPTATTTGTPAPGPPRILRLDIAPLSPRVNESVRFVADIAGGVPTRWRWTILKPDKSIETTSDVAEFNHIFAVSGEYQVTLKVSDQSSYDEKTAQLIVAPIIPPVNCGDTIVVNTRLERDLVCPGNGLIIGASGVDLDLNGHTITGSGSAIGIADGQAGVSSSHGDFILRNGTITKFAMSFAFYRSVRPRVINMRLVDNPDQGTDETTINFKGSGFELVGGESRGAGLHLLESQAPVIRGASFDSRGLLVRDSNDAVVSGNRFTDSGVAVTDSEGVLVEENTFTRAGIRTLGVVSDMTLRSNSFSGFMDRFDLGTIDFRGTPGIRLQVDNNRFTDNATVLRLSGYVEGTKITNNTFSGNRFGIHFGMTNSTYRERITVSGNTFEFNKVAGVFLQGSVADGVDIKDNTFRSNGHQYNGYLDSAGMSVNDGLHINVAVGADVVVMGNLTFDNADYGIEAQPGMVRDGGGNTSSGDPRGCSGVQCI